jgi:tetratricopeptide (TPR) repeat protein
MTGDIPRTPPSSSEARLHPIGKGEPEGSAGPAGQSRIALREEGDRNDWEGVADVLARNKDDTSDATRLPGAAYQSRLMAEGTRLPEVGYQSRLATAEEEASPERYVIGDVIGNRYEVLAIHRGTMGVVYGTFDRETNLPRALKTLQHRFAGNSTMRDLFKEEATTWVRLEKHPFIVRAHLVEWFDNQPYVVTEYIRGREGMAGDLRGWLGHPRLTLPVTVEMALQIAQGMQHATKKVPGLVHRDLKPANILVDDRGRARVTDFGLAHAAEADAGTPAYMAPEQWRRESLDPRVDLYAFGCILYEMLTGRRLFGAVSLEDWRDAHLSYAPVPARQLKPKLPAVLDDLVGRCLAKEVGARPANWDEVVSVCASAFFEATGQPAALNFSAYELNADELVSASYSLLTLYKHPEALDASDRAIRIDPRNSAAWLNKGTALQNLDRYDEAIGCYDRAIEINPSYASAWNNKGTALDDLERYDESLACYNCALELDPRDPAAWNNKGTALNKLKRRDEAIACCDRALEIDPRAAITWGNKGLVLNDLQRNDEAIVCCDRAIEIDPGYANAWVNKGWALHCLKRPYEAILCYERALDLTPRDAATWYAKGAVLQQLNRYDDAVACYDAAIQIDPRNRSAWMNKGNALQHGGQCEEAITCYDRALAIDPHYISSWYNKGGALISLQRYEEAIACYDHALVIDPCYTHAWCNKGAALKNLRRYEDAVACFDRALALDPGDAWTVNLRAEAAAAMKTQRGTSSC